MLFRVTRFGLLFASLLVATGCPSPSVAPVADAGEGEGEGGEGGGGDSGATEVVEPCSRPEACKQKGLEAVCRSGGCRSDVPCEDDVECSIGEACEGGSCRFVGCTQNSDCPTGRCLTDSYSCAECGASADCPADRPVCTAAGACVSCSSDAQCQPPGPGYCELTEGTCVHCSKDEHCPSGLSCNRGTCVGAPENAACGEGVECAQDLICVTVGAQGSKCLRACNLYTPSCPSGQLCLKLTFTGSPSLVFEQGAPIGVCSPPLNGLKYYKESCGVTQVCQPNLQCVQDTATTSTCKAFCDPAAPACATGEVCHSYPGDYSGREYGLCYPDNGVGAQCAREADCRSGLTCGPAPDPSEFSEVGTQCRFGAPNTSDGLTPCSNDTQCKSGLCANDTAVGATKFFCYTACDQDSDCAIGSRSGTCDNTSNITLPPYDPTTVRGCRPACQSISECRAYNSGFTCRIATVFSNQVTKARRSCGLPAGAGAIGASCALSSECASNYCYRRDARGQLRSGVCTAPCNDASDCSSPLSDGGTLGLPSCLPTTLNHSAGLDSVMNTADDRDAVAKICAPPVCTADEDCPARFPRCSADADPASTASGLSLRCRSDALGTKTGGQSCAADSECRSGACAELVPPSVGTGRVCLKPCVAASTTCDTGLTCRTAAARLLAKDGTASLFTACVP